MPEIDYMVVCDYVRGDAGVLHMVAAGIDRIRAESLPTGRNVGVGMRLALTRDECEHPHEIELAFHDATGAKLLSFRGEFRVTFPDDAPGDVAFAAFPVNLGLPLPAYGAYVLELLIDGVSGKRVSILVERPPKAIGTADAVEAD